MGRKRAAKEKLGMSVYPPAEVAAALGAFKTVELTLAIRVAAQLLGQAAAEASALFSPAEWAVLADTLEDRAVEPEVPNPGPLLAELVQQAAARFGVAGGLDGKKGAAPLVERLRALTYPQAWAVLIAVRFRREQAERIEDGAQWWDLPVRWRLLNQE